MPSSCLLHLGFDNKAIIYGVIVLLYYVFGCCQSYPTELWVFFSDHLMCATSWWQLFLNILGALSMMQTQKYCFVVSYTCCILLKSKLFSLS